MADEPKPTPLAQAIQDLRSSLAQAIELGKDKDLKLEVGNIELELGLIATQEAGGGGKVSFSLFGLGSEANLGGKLAREATHRIKLNLTPKFHNSMPVLAFKKPELYNWTPVMTVNPDGSLTSKGSGGVVTVTIPDGSNTIPDGSKISVENIDWTKK